MNRTRKFVSPTKLPSTFKGLLGVNTPLNITRRQINRNNSNSNKYFDNSHVFVLAGHSVDIGGPRYKLKDNEYYSSPTQCGRNSTNTEESFFKWVQHNPKIKIPNESYTLNYNNFPFKQTSSVPHAGLPTSLPYFSEAATTAKIVKGEYNNSRLLNLLTLQKTKIDNWKIYFPESSFEKSNSIPNFSYQYFNVHNLSMLYPFVPTAYKKMPSFIYKGIETYISPFSLVNLSFITLSGVLQPNMWTEELQEEYNRLKITSNLIEDIAFFNKTAELPINIKSYIKKYHLNPIGVTDRCLWFFYPNRTISHNTLKELNKKEKSRISIVKNVYSNMLLEGNKWDSALYNSQESYALYLKDVLEFLSKLSFIDYKDYIDVNNPALKFKDVLNLQLDSYKLFTDIRRKLGDDKPIFVLNPLCRGSSPSVRNKIAFVKELTAYIVPKILKRPADWGINLVTSPASYYLSSKEANESNNEANERSFKPGSTRAISRQTRKIKKPGWF